jgi:hypothetical protein
MAELTAEQRMMERAECDRREDVVQEREFWKEVFFCSFGEGEKITSDNMTRALANADRAGEEFRRRFQ